MKLVIDIPEHMYSDIKNRGYSYLYAEDLALHVINGTLLEWTPISNKRPQNGQHIFISTVTGKIHDVIWNSDCIHNFARNGCWYKNWFVLAWMPFFITPYKVEGKDKT